jgi:Xaa-Pro aminopeptidase
MALPKSEFEARIHRLRRLMAEEDIDLFLIYGDEYRREHLRYVSNYWPIFERGMLVVGKSGEPVLLVAPECFHYAKETSVWGDLRIVQEMEMAYVADQIEYSGGSQYTTLSRFSGCRKGQALKGAGLRLRCHVGDYSEQHPTGGRGRGSAEWG